ncbi:1-acyl-sn-glycerol-3-phosphate acyltransferase [Jiangella mangrovi]|uniref:1-acyl-sn-glycerol-3-phosphate acyltransferase n=1 Tax=Jiangella mangrovi TaxID=1524084 RepID=A0A7W9LN74_9ACTN|nr:1-acyl-sn-glycerol-3-phosphate acyltransferase [Jiangella mangrovi]
MAGPSANGPAGVGFAFKFIATLLRPFLMAFTRQNWRGGEHIPPAGTGVVVAGNHISHFDPLSFAHFLWDNGRATRYLAKSGVFRVPVFGRLITAAGQIPVYRESRDASQAYRAAVAAVDAGELVAIYPEGTISRDPGLWPMVGKTGAARVALETGCDVIPVAQWGANHVLAPYSKRIRLLPRKTMSVTAGPPVDLDDLRGKPVDAVALRIATDRIMAAITAQLAEIRGEIAPAERFDPKAVGLPPVGDPKHQPDQREDQPAVQPRETEEQP